MSYSFSLRAPTKAALLEAVGAEWDKIVSAQPIHAADRDAAVANITAQLGLIEPREGKDFSLSANGYVSTDGNGLVSTSIAAAIHLISADQ